MDIYNVNKLNCLVIALHITLSISIGPAIVSLYGFTVICKLIRTIGHRKRHKSLEKRVEVCNFAAV